MCRLALAQQVSHSENKLWSLDFSFAIGIGPNEHNTFTVRCFFGEVDANTSLATSIQLLELLDTLSVLHQNFCDGVRTSAMVLLNHVHHFLHRNRIEVDTLGFNLIKSILVVAVCKLMQRRYIVLWRLELLWRYALYEVSVLCTSGFARFEGF